MSEAATTVAAIEPPAEIVTAARQYVRALYAADLLAGAEPQDTPGPGYYAALERRDGALRGLIEAVASFELDR